QEASVTSLYSPVTLQQDNSVLYIGERTNANGSRAFRDAMLAGDWDTCTKMANEQIREGAHVLDVCVDYVGRDGAIDMREIAGRFASQASVPLVIDSTEPQVMEAALQLAGGRCILNSANLEDGEEPGRRMDRVFTLARDYGAAVICLLIDERGQARDVEWKMQIAHRLHKIATERYGLSSSDLIFDPLTFPLTTGDADLRRDGIESIEAIRRIKAEIPGALTVMGLSNVSFGINPAARQVLNSVFLDECVKAGLDSAIVHASKILPLARIKPEHLTLCRDIIFDKTTPDYNPLQLLLTAFEGVKSTKQEKPDRSGWPARDRLRQRIIDGDRDGLTADLDAALGEGLKALEIVNDVLLDGMREVGELFGAGQMQLPFVLQSAETMKTAVSHLEPHMDKVAGSTSKGKLVLATVKGDVHDIGKNLVDIICTNNGYEVHNIGIKIPISEMIAKVQEVDADALGMSGLLVKSTLIMRDNLEELNNQGLSRIPVLLGGAALTRSYVERDLREVYDGRVFYGRDAFEGLHTLDKLMELKRSGIDDPEFGRIPTGRSLAERRGPKETAVDLPRRSPEVVSDNTVFTPPFLGSRVVKGISLDEIAEYVNETALFRNQWQYRPLEGENDDDFKTRIRPELRAQLAEAKASGILVPQLVYGYFPANGDGNDVV
ncbi:MAG: dihydropteroate synthase, partial [Ilumatobacteraceae bacterium]